MELKKTTKNNNLGRTVKLSEKYYIALSKLLNGQRQRARVLEALIDVLVASVKENKYILFDILTDPQSLEIGYRKKK
jgi:hypothetical protein